MRTFHRLLGLLELGVAVALVVLGAQIPHGDEVTAGFGLVSQVTTGAEKEVSLIRGELDHLKRQDFAKRTDLLRQHTRTVSETAAQQQIDFRTVEALAQALGDVSKAIRGWGDTVDPERMKTISAGFAATADMLDKNAAASEKAAKSIWPWPRLPETGRGWPNS